jgi:hypothetical protein
VSVLKEDPEIGVAARSVTSAGIVDTSPGNVLRVVVVPVVVAAAARNATSAGIVDTSPGNVLRVVEGLAVPVVVETVTGKSAASVHGLGRTYVPCF